MSKIKKLKVLACGNCHEAELVEKLIGKDKIRIICTDPPYGVNYWYGRHKFERSKGKSVIDFDKPNKSKLHPTMKPVGLLRKMILNSTKAREYVYDPFGGSGSTMIACENTARKCLMIELDEAYCDIIIKRWEKLTGKESKK